MGNKNFFLTVIVFLLIIGSSHATLDKLDVGSCTASGCTVVGWNNLNNLPDGSTLLPSGTDSLTMNNPTFSGIDAINSISVWLSHSGDAGIKGNTDLSFRNGANTVTYCTSSIANTGSYRYEVVTPTGCAWTLSRLQDLVIYVTNGDTKKSTYNDFINFSIDYTAYSDSNPPTVSLGNPINNSWSTTKSNIFYYTPTELENTINNCSLIINGSINKTISSGIINGSTNSITQNITDGVWSWTVNCTDSWNNTGTGSPSKTLKVDTTPPVVNLETPGNNSEWTATQSISFFFNASDLLRGLQVCELIIDGSSRDNIVSPLEDTSLSFTYSPGNGLHNWSVNCTDDGGLEKSSGIFNLSVNYAGRTVLTDSGSYEQGSNVTITGANWNDGIVTLKIDLPNGSSLVWNTTATAGSINTWYYINYSYPVGQYNLSGYEFSIPINNASNMFTVSKRISTLSTDKSTYIQGEKIEINGSGFSPYNNLTLNITWAGGSNITNQTSDATGKFSFNFQTLYTSFAGIYNITAIDNLFSNLNSTANFTLNSRIPSLLTDKSNYASNEIVKFYGFNFSILANLDLYIFENSSGVNAPFYPKIVYANDSGNFFHQWNVTDTCPGVYGVRAEDKNYTSYNETYFFNLTGASVDYNYTPSATTGGAPGLVSSLYTADDANQETLTINGLVFIEIDFNNTFVADSDITYAMFRLKHYVSDVSKVSFVRLDWLNGTWQTVTGCSITAPSVNTLQYCDLSNYVKNGSQANDLKLRIYYTKTGATQYSYIDYAHMDVTVGGSGACTSWSNQPPSISYMSVDDQFPSPGNQIDLIAGGTTPVYCNVTAYDFDGIADIKNVTGTFYYYLNNTYDSDDNTTHYSDTNCTLTGDNGVDTKYFSCNFNLTHFVNNGSWYCNATVNDIDNVSTSLADGVNISELYAVNITSNVFFANTSTGFVSPEIITSIVNIGNVEIDIGIDGYGVTDGDGIAMNCTQANISLSDLRYNLSSGVAFDSMTPLSDTMNVLTGFNLVRQINSTLSNKNLYWKVKPTPPAFGNCQGVIVFTAMG